MRLLEFLSATKQKHRIDELVDVSSPAFRQWFRNSKVVDKKGQPLMLFHGTAHPEEFDKLKGVSHFGTLKAADTYAWFQDPTARAGPRIYPVYLRIENPVRMYDSARQHTAYTYAQDITKANRGNAALADSLRALLRDWVEEAESYGYSRNSIEDGRPWKGEARRMRHLIQVLERNGFDGIVYVNKEEHIGTTSWVTFHEDQVKYAYAESAEPTRQRRLNELVDVNSPAFRQWFNGSEVVDANGAPAIVYHRTSVENEFLEVQPMTHFGSLGATSAILSHKPGHNPRIYPAYLSIRHPIEIKDHGEHHDIETWLELFVKMGILGQGEVEAMEESWLEEGWLDEDSWGNLVYVPAHRADVFHDLARTLRGLGYDGIHYTNAYEDAGSDAWVVFRPNQVKYVYSESQITEAREGLLYHWINPIKLEYALKRDSMHPEWRHNDPLTGEDMHGNSMSRNVRLVMPEATRLVFDQARLAQTNKIIPLDADYVFHRTRQLSKNFGRMNPEELSAMRTRTVSKGAPYSDFAEEFVLGPITPLHKYLVRIDYDDKSGYFALGRIIDEYARKYNIPVREAGTNAFKDL